jgi:hypothetical protein
VRFEVLAAAGRKMTVFWDVAPCSLIEIDWHFRRANFIIRAIIDLIMDAFETSVNFFHGATSQKTVFFKTVNIPLNLRIRSSWGQSYVFQIGLQFSSTITDVHVSAHPQHLTRASKLA